jgi:hypothetical protein
MRNCLERKTLVTSAAAGAHLWLGQGRLIVILLHESEIQPVWAGGESQQSPRVNFRLTIGHAASS